MLKSYVKIKYMELPKITKPSIGVPPIQFLTEVKAELKKVKWPSQKEVIKMTSIVIGISTLVGLFLSTVDLGFTKLFSYIIK